MRFLIYIFFMLAWRFEPRHDAWLFNFLFKSDRSAIKNEELKMYDLGMHVCYYMMCITYEWMLTQDPWWCLLTLTWFAATAWVFHDFWYSHDTGGVFGTYGRTIFIDRIMRKLDLPVGKARAVMITPFVLLSAALMFYDYIVDYIRSFIQ